MSERTATRRVDVGKAELRVARLGPPGVGPPLLLCNGIGANLELWDPLLAHLDREVVVFDAPGVGGSSVTLYPHRLPLLSDLVARMLDRIGVDTVDVLGLSWGGALAQQLARRHGDRVRRLVLAGTMAGWTAVPGSPRVLRHMVSPRRYRDPEHLLSIAGEIYGGDARGQPDLLRRHGQERFLQQAGTQGYVWQLLAARRWTSVPWLHRLPQPTLVLSGDDDPIVPLVNARLLARLIPGARLEVVPGGGHLFLLLRAQEYGPRLTRFLTDDLEGWPDRSPDERVGSTA